VSFFAADASWLAILAGTDRNRATGSCRLPAVDTGGKNGTPDGFAGHEDVAENSAELSQTGGRVITAKLSPRRRVEALSRDVVFRKIWRRGGLYFTFFHNCLVFCHLIRKTRIFCRLRPSLENRHPSHVAQGLTTGTERSSKCDMFRVASVA
jgi:hypothetical protein